MTVTISRPDEYGVRAIDWAGPDGRPCRAFARGILAAWRIASGLRRGDLSVLRY